MAARAAMSARITARSSGCPSSGRSAPTASPTRATSAARSPPSKSSDEPCQVVAKFEGNLWAADFDHSPLDVVAWHGNYAPYAYDLARFNTLGTVSFDHPDPSIFTVLTAPTDTPGTANCDFVIFPPRWLVAEHTFRPPWFHRNYMNEFMGLVQGVYDAKAEGFVPGGASLHNCMSAHGPDRATFESAVAAELKPQKIEDTLAFMFETRLVIRPTRFALETPALQRDYDACWAGFREDVQGVSSPAHSPGGRRDLVERPPAGLGADLRHRDGGDRHHHRDAGHYIAEPVGAQKADRRKR